jgi:tetratricopeptide (TPR) repeat protein
LDRLSLCVVRWGGYVDKFIGDCVMALFGAPVAYENEAERAVRAALDMHEALRECAVGRRPERADRPGYRPQLRIGINTGPVVTGLFAGGGAGNYTAVGDTVNVAARLERYCEPGRILVDATTYRQTGHLFDFDDERVLQVKGRREPVPARYVVAARARRGKARGFPGRRTPFIGRSDELRRLRDRWHRAERGEFQLCMITGPAGIGKSRLVEELISIEELNAGQVAQGRSYPYASSTPWEPVAELIRELYGLAADLAPTHAAAQVVAGTGTSWAEEQVAAVAVAFGVPMSAATQLKGYSTVERSERISAAVIRCLRCAAQEPRLLVLEDLHWADRTTLEFLARLPELGLTGPILMTLISRPHLPGETALARFIESIGDRIDLGPLTAGESLELLETLLGSHELPADFLARLIGNAEGNPLFVEETLRSLTETGRLARRAGVWQAQGDLQDFRVPDTIESVLTTRIDGLDSSTKSVLQYAAIVGRRFWSGVLTDALVNRPVERELGQLLDGAFVRALPFSTVRGDREFLFEHLLLQQVAYDGMLRRLRSELHAAVARWLERRLGNQADEYAEWIAFHYERSNEPERALPYLESAALASRDRGSLSDAEALVARATKLARSPDSRANLLLLAEELAAEAGDVHQRSEALVKLEALAAEQSDERITAEAGCRRAGYLLDMGDLDAARSTAEKALERFERLGDVSQQGDVLRLLGRISHLSGDFSAALRSYRASLPLERQAGDRYGQAGVFDRLGLVLIDLGDFTTGLDYFEAARDLCAELGQRPTEARVIGHQARALHWLGRYEEAEDTARAALDLAERCGSVQAQLGAKLTLARVLAARGGTQEADSLAREVQKSAQELGQPGLEARAWLLLSEVETGEAALRSARRAHELACASGVLHIEVLAQTREAELRLDIGDLTRADSISRAATRKLEAHGDIQGPEEAVFYIRARTLMALGRAEAARELLERARGIVHKKAGRIEDSGLRRRFLEEIRLNREILGPELAP